MHNPFDQLAKKVGKGALDASGPTVVQYEISRDAQHADLRHEPDPARGAERARLGLLGRMAEVVCLIEIFGHAPDGAEVRACMSKHFAHWEECATRGRARNRRRKLKDLPAEPIAAPFLWILAATLSAPLLLQLEPRAAAGWPAGVYLHGGDVCRVGIVVADELPRDNPPSSCASWRRGLGWRMRWRISRRCPRGRRSVPSRRGSWYIWRTSSRESQAGPRRKRSSS